MGHRRKHMKPYGVIYDESTSTPTLERIGQGQSCAAATKLPDNLMVLQNAMKGCLQNDAGVVQYYTDPTDRTLKENGDPSVLTGADGQVMTEIPLGWLKYWYEGTCHHYLISKEQFNGAERIQSHFKNGAWVDKRYMSAYEGVLYDNSVSKYTNGLQLPAVSMTFASATKFITCASLSHPFTLLEAGDKFVIGGTIHNNGTLTVASKTDQTITTVEALTGETAGSTTLEIEKNWANDVLSSVSGKAPINYGTRANFRAASATRGTGWRQQDYDLVSAIQLLYLVEYASWNSQSMIGNGLTSFGGTNWANRSNYNPIEVTGLSNALGNASGGVDNGDNALGSYMSYRGIENFFGHLWKWVDGINIGGASSADNCKTHACNNDAHFADNTWTNYVDLGIVLPGSHGWQVALEQISRGFLPASIGGASYTYICDYYYQNSGWRVASLGGYADDGTGAGVACWSLSASSALRLRFVVGRLSF